MSAKIIVACGSGVATSQAVASKVNRLLREADIDAEVEAVDIKQLKRCIGQADAYISIVNSDEEYDIPEFNGVAFLTGIGQEQEFKKLVDTIENL